MPVPVHIQVCLHPRNVWVVQKSRCCSVLIMSSSPKENSTWNFTHGPFSVFFPPKDSSTWNFTHEPFSRCVFYEISSGQTCHPQIITLPVVHIFMSSFKMYSLTLYCFAILSSSGQEQGLLSAGVQSHSGGWS